MKDGMDSALTPPAAPLHGGPSQEFERCVGKLLAAMQALGTNPLGFSSTWVESQAAIAANQEDSRQQEFVTFEQIEEDSRQQEFVTFQQIEASNQVDEEPTDYPSWRRLVLTGFARKVKYVAPADSNAAALAERVMEAEQAILREESLREAHAQIDAAPKETIFRQLREALASNDADHPTARLLLERRPRLRSLFDRYFQRMLAGDLGGCPTPVEAIVSCGATLDELALTFETEPTREGDGEFRAFVEANAHATELGYALECPEAVTIGDLRSWVAHRRAAHELPQDFLFDPCYMLAALCSSAGKEGRALRKHGVTTEKALAAIQKARAAL